MTRHHQPAALLLLLLITAAVYSPVGGFAFVNYDDGDYVYDNPRVRQGLTLEGVKWALTARHSGNWHPLTWISHMADVSVYGLHAGGHHLTNLVLHLLNTALLYAALRSITGRWVESLAVAAIFALHPLHVQSVAWVAERKDVLSTCLAFAALVAYGRYGRRPSVTGYLTVALLLAAGLMAKAMPVTLPLVFLLLDHWPLDRWATGNRGRLILEKLPLLGLCAVAAVLAVMAQREQQALAPVAVLPLDARLANAAVAYVTYLCKFFWPVHLSVFYPHPVGYALWKPLAAGLVLIAISGVVFRSRRPALVVGWLWYLGTLVPVIGLVQVGIQAMADRYTYVPLVGWSIVVVWGVAEAAARWRIDRRLVVATGGLVVVLGLAATGREVRAWADSESLYQQALAVVGSHPVLHYNLANHYLDRGRYDQAIAQYEKKLALDPDAEAYNNQGLAHWRMGRPDLAQAGYEKALAVDPTHAPAHTNLANLRWAGGDLAAALSHWQQAVSLQPANAVYRDNLGFGLAAAGDMDGAVAQFRLALQLDPALERARRNLQRAMERRNRPTDSQ